MPRKELISSVIEAIAKNQPKVTRFKGMETLEHSKVVDYTPTAIAAISTIRAAQDEHIEAEIDGYIENFRNMSRINGVHVTRALATLKRRLIDESPLGEQSE